MQIGTCSSGLAAWDLQNRNVQEISQTYVARTEHRAPLTTQWRITMHQRGSKTRKFDVIAAALALSVATPLAAADWSDTYLFTNYGSAYKFPGTKFDTTPSGDNYRDKD